MHDMNTASAEYRGLVEAVDPEVPAARADPGRTGLLLRISPRLRCLPAAIALLPALIFALPAGASVITVGDARFPVMLVDETGGTMELKGAGLARYAVFVRIYGAGLYGPEGVSAADLLERGDPKRLEIEYFVDVGASDLALAANTILERQLTTEQLRALEPRVRQLHQAYRNVRPGDRYVMEYLPEQGTVLRLNGEPLITVEGRDFARAYFGIWLGEHPLSRSLRDALLGLTAP